MAQKPVVRIIHEIYAIWKLCLSIGTNDWELSDYPVVIHEKELDAAHVGTRYKHHRYTAHIVNWGLVGSGDTKDEAMSALGNNLAMAKSERAKSQTSLPRPGTRVPIQFASQERVGRHPELAEDFVHSVLELDWVWISDESSLWDFHHGETNDALISKINEIYGVDVSDIQSARLSEIFERIATEQRTRRH